MEAPIKNQKVQAMKGYKRAKFFYNLVLYTLTSIITCFFFSSPFWFPSTFNHFSFSFQEKLSLCFNAKCFFVVGNLIVFILVGESRLKQSTSPSSSTSDIYDEYVARSRSNLHKAAAEKTLIVEEKVKIHHHEEKKKEIKGMRSCKSEVWGEGGMVKTEKVRVRKGEVLNGEKVKMGMRSSKSAVWSESDRVRMEKGKGKKDGENMKMGMRSSKSAIWSESERVKMEKGKGKKKEQVVMNKTSMNREEEKKIGMRSSKSAVWSESEILERENPKEEIKAISTIKEEGEEEKKMVMRSSKSAVWGESEIVEKEKAKGLILEEKKMGMRNSKSEVWSERQIVRLGKSVGKEEEVQQIDMLNKRVEDFIARVNKQRTLEAKLVDHGKG